jgi:hypothetical protein
MLQAVREHSSFVHVYCGAFRFGDWNFADRMSAHNEKEITMKFRRLMLSAAAALTITGTGYTAMPAKAQDVNIYVDIPGFGRLPGYEYGGRRYISCRHGARIVDRRGYNRVQPFDCNRPTYRYRARRGGIWWIVRLNARTGFIVGARPT